jgi:hypothetical protein
MSGVEASALGEVGVVVSVEGFSFSSTPCPLQSGQEFRPLVSHYHTTISQRSKDNEDINLPGLYTPCGRDGCI